MDSKQLGQNIIHLRGQLSQGELAQKMTDRGHKWVQNTVSMIELGTRTLKLFEAVDLAAILGVTVDELLNNDSTALAAAHERAQVAAAQTKLRAAYHTALEGQLGLLAARVELLELLEKLRDTGTGEAGPQFDLMFSAHDFNHWGTLVGAIARAGDTGLIEGISSEDLKTTEGRIKIREAIKTAMGVDLYERPLT